MTALYGGSQRYGQERVKGDREQTLTGVHSPADRVDRKITLNLLKEYFL